MQEAPWVVITQSQLTLFVSGDLDNESIAILTAKTETQLSFSSGCSQFSEISWFQDGQDHFVAREASTNTPGGRE